MEKPKTPETPNAAEGSILKGLVNTSGEPLSTPDDASSRIVNPIKDMPQEANPIIGEYRELESEKVKEDIEDQISDTQSPDASLQPEFKEPIVRLKSDIRSDYHEKLNLNINVFTQETVFCDNVLTVDGDILFDNYKKYGNPFYPISKYIGLMDANKPFNVTRWVPSIGSIILIGIGAASPLVIAGVYGKKDRIPIDELDVTEFFVAGVFHKDHNDKFGMKVVYHIQPGTKQINFELDPKSGYNQSKVYADLRKDLLRDKTANASARISVRTIILCDEMEIQGYSF